MIKQKKKNWEKKSTSPWNVLFFLVEDSWIILFVPKLYDILCSSDISSEKWWLVSLNTEALLLRYLWKSSITFRVPGLQLGYCGSYLLFVFLSFCCFLHVIAPYGMLDILPLQCLVFGNSFLTMGFTVSWNFMWPYIFRYFPPYMFMYADTWSHVLQLRVSPETPEF